MTMESIKKVYRNFIIFPLCVFFSLYYYLHQDYIQYVKVYIFCRIEKWIKVPKYCIFQVVSIFWKLFEIEHEID